MRRTGLVILGALLAVVLGQSVGNGKAAAAPRPPTTLTYYLSGLDGPKDKDAIRASVAKLKSVTAIDVNLQGGYVTVVFDSHVVSYHQVAQAIVDAGTAAGKKYDPYLKVSVPEYPQGDNAIGAQHGPCPWGR
jgi:copper chaperone CopZ